MNENKKIISDIVRLRTHKKVSNTYLVVLESFGVSRSVSECV